MKTYPPATAVAAALGLMFSRSGEKRALVTDKTFRLVSNRRHKLHASFLSDVAAALLELDLVFFPSSKGGFGILGSGALSSAPKITAKLHLADFLAEIKTGAIPEVDILRELNDGESEPFLEE
jgi:hypothetical protein